MPFLTVGLHSKYFPFVMFIFRILVCFNAVELHAGYNCSNSTKIVSHFAFRVFTISYCCFIVRSVF